MCFQEAFQELRRRSADTRDAQRSFDAVNEAEKGSCNLSLGILRMATSNTCDRGHTNRVAQVDGDLCAARRAGFAVELPLNRCGARSRVAGWHREDDNTVVCAVAGWTAGYAERSNVFVALIVLSAIPPPAFSPREAADEQRGVERRRRR